MFDLVINNVLIIDGKANKPFKGSIGIIKDKIATISKDEMLSGIKIIDGKSHVLAPGFLIVLF